MVESLPTEEAKANTTDPDSRIMKTRQGYVRNAQAVVSEGQSSRWSDPPMSAPNHGAYSEGSRHRGPAKSGLADAGYWSEANIRACLWMPELHCQPRIGNSGRCYGR